jgi:hypothetical protein
MQRLRLAWVSCATLLCTSVALAQTTDPFATAIFAGRNLTFNIGCRATGGPVVANGNVVHNGNLLDVPSLYAGGSFSATAGSVQHIHGEVLFGGDIAGLGGPGVSLEGNITSGGNISLSSAPTTLSGNVTAAGSVTQPSFFATIAGNVLAGGDVNIQGTVRGSVTYGGLLTKGVFAQVGGPTVHGGPVTPPAFVPLTLPTGRNLAAGTTDITLGLYESCTLDPGVYGTLNFDTGNAVYLSAGQYVFAGINSSFPPNRLSFDTTKGPINVYVAGDLDYNVVQVVNGQWVTVGGNPNLLDSQNIFLEVAGSLRVDSSFFGTVFAPNADITLGLAAQVTGHVVAGRDVILNSAGVTVAPEPNSLTMLLALCGVSLLRCRIRERR